MRFRLLHLVVFAAVTAGVMADAGSLRSDMPKQRRRAGAASGIDLVSISGQRFVGEQLQAFSIAPDGSVSTSKAAWLSLYYTENKPFQLSGQVWLGGADDALLHAGDLPDGFALFLREWDGMHRYAFTSRGVDVKRRQHEGERLTGITHVAKFEPPRTGRWVPFRVSSNWDQTEFKFGKQTAMLKGPLDLDGANKIAIAPGTKLRNLRLSVFTPAHHR